MLNNFLEKYLQQKFTPSTLIKDLHWRSQDSNKNSLLFYKVGNKLSDEAVFHQRISNASYAHLIINRTIQPMPVNCSVVNENEWPQLQKDCLDLIYPLPSLRLIGITGTNGKTTTADLVLQLGHQVGKKGISIGTLGVRELGKTIVDFGLTSPPLIDLRKYLYQYGQDKDFCVMEASSHALEQQRLYGIQFDCAGWLSFSQDHLDYHKTMENYFSAKKLIFQHLKKNAVVFLPSEQKELIKKLSKEAISLAGGISADLPLFFQTQFNQNNLEVAAGIINFLFKSELHFDYQKLNPPDGRFYIKSYRSNYIVIDFAHTPDALENICKGIRKAFPHHQLKVLFGCGGDRDRTKRALMGEIADKYADDIYVTSDNPRSEDPAQIIQDIIHGFIKNTPKVIIDRPAAVKRAFESLNENEILLLAGKGHEDYILINGIKYPYSDIGEIEKLLKGKLHD
jgi:UDP-N-acetylmuramoyl-L-alanyl-D-glutamate--2,6-diaminopimelate ligase